MAFDQIRLDRPLSRLELVMLAIVISLCAAWLMHRLAYLEAVAEARALDLTVRSMRTGLMVSIATRLLQGNSDAIEALAKSNPVGAIIDAPPGYIGALYQANPANIHPGQWYFDEDAKCLVYHIVNADYFEGTAGKPVRVRIRLKLNYDDRNGNHAYDAGVDTPTGVGMEILDPPKWKF